MKICFDWGAIHKGLVCEPKSRATAALLCAEQIRDDISRRGYPAHQLVGKAPDICKQFGLGRETFLEAARLLENWGVARMRRGAQGGLIVVKNVQTTPTAKLARYFQLRGLSKAQVHEARTILNLAIRYCRDWPVDQSGSLDREFRYCIGMRNPFTDQNANYKLRSEIPWENCLQIFVGAIDTVDACTEGLAETAAAYGGSHSLAGYAVHLLAGEIASLDREDRHRTRSEASITANLGVSRQVTRQAMRILQDEGIVQCRLGRSGGVDILPEHPAHVIRLLSASYRKAGLTRAEFFPLLSIIGRANRILCGMRASERDFNDMTRLTAEQKFDEPVTQIKRIKLDWEIIDNPVLSLLEQSLATYRASLAGETVSTGFGNLQLIADRTLDQLNALRARNFALADSLGQHIDAEIAVITDTF